MASMRLNEYQDKALETAQYPETSIYNYEKSLYTEPVYDEISYVYPALGLVGEAGEVAEKIKKLIRDKNGEYDDSDVEAIKKELGDVLWYVSVLADEFGLTLEDVAKGNNDKLSSRKERNMIQGNGDNR